MKSTLWRTNQQSALAWKIVNNISSRKSTANQRERLDKWKQHFSNLLGKAPTIIDEKIQTVIDHKLPIKKVWKEKKSERSGWTLSKRPKATKLRLTTRIMEIRRFNDALSNSVMMYTNKIKYQIGQKDASNLFLKWVISLFQITIEVSH